MIISRTPFRVSFFGGGTDYPAWYQKYGGSVLAATINKYCYITCRFLPPFFEHRIRLVYSRIENCQRIEEINHPAVREVLRYLDIDRGVEIHHDGDLPARSGMGSSSSFAVGLLHALYALKGRMPHKQQLAVEGIHVEQKLLRENVGSQDQVLAAYGGLNHIVFHPDGQISVKPVTVTAERIQALNAHLMLFYTGVERTASDIAATYVNNIEEKARELGTMREMVEQSLSVLNGDRDLALFGRLLHEAWLAKRRLSSKVSNAHVDEIYSEALSAGAIGGKLLGAGGGGFLLLFVFPELHQTVRAKLSKLIHVPFKFEFAGSQIIFYDPEEDYSAEEQDRATRTIRPFQKLDRW